MLKKDVFLRPSWRSKPRWPPHSLGCQGLRAGRATVTRGYEHGGLIPMVLVSMAVGPQQGSQTFLNLGFLTSKTVVLTMLVT